ncbi:DUF4397 domain-containing protein [Rhodohalobacter sp. 8-1]|uniref:DUF4397 domain-containing protein n=1 Tax=Rhodohalobacter sp. 8-1 TaxID=3131972 RepID=UPI0030EC2DBD
MKYLATISKLMLGALMLFAFSASTSFGQVLLENDLRSGTAPADWTATDMEFRDSAGGYALLNQTTSQLTSPSFDLSGVTEATLSFQVAKFGSGDDGPLTVEVSIDGGTTWDAQTYTSPTPTGSSYEAAEMVFDASVLGESDVTFRFNRPNSPSAKRLRDVLVLGPDGISLPTPTEVSTIAELRNGTADGETRYRLTGEALVHFYDSFRGRRMLVDGTAGIWSVDLDDSFTDGTTIGDGITGLEGTLNLTNNDALLRFELDAGAADATVTSTGNTIDPETITIPNLSLDDTGKLVLIEGVTFQETGEFSTGTNYTLEDGDGNTLTFRTDYFGADYIGEPIPTGTLYVTGVVGGYGSSPQIFARSSADLDLQGAGLQIIHNSPDPAVSSVDIFVNGESFLSDVAFRSATNFMSVPAGVDLSIEIAPAGQGIEAALDPIVVNLTDDENYIAVASGVLNVNDFTFSDTAGKEFSLELFTGAQTQATDPAKVDLLVQHGSPDTPAVDVYLEQTGDQTPAIGGLTYPSFVGYTPIDPNNELITVAVADGEPVTSFAAPLADLDAGGAAITVLASGFFLEGNQTGNNALALIAVLADGTVLTLEEFSLTQSIAYANLQWPPDATITTTETVDVYGQVYAEGITEADGAPAGMNAWVGVSSTDTDPATWSEESWTEATYNEQKGNNDEYVATIGDGLAPGTYYYATRYRYEQEQYVYGGYTEQGGGFWEENVNVSGVLTVTPAGATIAEARAAEAGSFFEITGLVSSPDFGFGVADYYVQDNTAGINVTDFDSGGARSGVVVAPGDSIRIVGETAVFRNQQNIEVIEFEIINSGNPLPEPQVITAAEYNADSDLQGSRVLLENVTLTEASEADWPTDPISSGSGVNVTFENEAGETFIIRLARNNTFFSSGTPVPTGPVNITGSLGQFDDDTQLFPFFEGDISPVTVPTQVQIIHNSADPAVSSVDIYVDGTLTLEDVAFRSATGFIELPSNTAVDIGVTPTGEPLSSGVTFQNNFFDPGNYYVVASGVLDPSGFQANPSGEDIDLELFVIPNAELSAPDEDTFSFRIHHGTTDAPAVDVFARNVGPLATDVTYGATTPAYADVAVGSYTIDIAPAGGNVIASFEADANALGGESALILASGFLTPDNDKDGEPFGALLVLDDGTTALLPAVSTSIDEIDGVPQQFALEQNFPNPFNPTTQIEYALPQAADVQIAVYNVVGQRVAVLLNNEQQSAGYHTVSFDASNLASGMYLYRIQAGNFIQTRKMTLIK